MQKGTGMAAVVLISTLITGCGRQGSSLPTPPGAQIAAEDGASAVEVVIREFEFEPRSLKVKAGTVRFLLTNRGAVDHDFAVLSLEGHDNHGKHLVKPGESKTVELDLKPGTYEAICTLPGHKEAGMTVAVEVGS